LNIVDRLHKIYKYQITGISVTCYKSCWLRWTDRQRDGQTRWS